MWEYDCLLTGIFLYKDRIVDSLLMRKNTGKRESYCRIFYAALISRKNLVPKVVSLLIAYQTAVAHHHLPILVYQSYIEKFKF